MVEAYGVGLDLGHGREDVATTAGSLVLNCCGVDACPVYFSGLRLKAEQCLGTAVYNHASLKWILLWNHNSKIEISERSDVVEGKLVHTEV